MIFHLIFGIFAGIAVLNFDTQVADVVTPAKVKAVSKATSATASDFVIAGALPQSEAPSGMPSMQPSVSAEPSSQPTMSAMPTSMPSESPSLKPSVSAEPSLEPSVSSVPSREPSTVPTLTQTPTAAPSTSHMPSISLPPTPAPTSRKVFEQEFQSRDIGYVGISGMSHNPESGLYIVEGSGHDIWVSVRCG